MNKPISIQQTKKSMDIFDEQENYEEDCFSDEIEEIKNLSISSSISNDLNSNAKLFLQKTDICQNEKCIENRNEIEKITDE